ncbi:nuclear apoptosis-inducing factor 1 [Trichomycterus rosablanca]|uniref:nuclear apoptosis-inducing factor 1 n=1 Tax=Trichomycterus rosablanca TaxID=2290929 RepID=UPI002F351580
MSGFPCSDPDSAGGTVQFKKRKSRFTLPEVQLLLSEVKRNRHILVGKLNHGISSDVKKRTWASLTARINEISDCHREIIEVVKKWADLKCDTKRKVAAMRASGLSSARIAANLSPVERMVQQILIPGPGEKLPCISVATDKEDKEEDTQGILGIAPHSSGIANGKLPIQTLAVPLHTDLSSKEELDTPIDYNSAVPLTDLQFDQSDKEDRDMQFSEVGHQPSRNTTTIPDSPSADREQIRKETKPSCNSKTSGGKSSNAAIFHPPSSAPSSLSSHLAKSASLSLQEQQATTLLIGTLSRSLETVAESVQSLVQTQQEFVRDTLRLQRDTLHVLRDFSSSALALLQDKSNGHP